MGVIAKRSLIILGALILLIGAFSLWVWLNIHVPNDLEESTAPPRGDVLLSEFYAQPDTLPGQPGILIRQEALEGEPILAKAGQNLRIMYSSTEGLSGTARNAVSGALYLPEGDAPEGGWPLLVWSHGTVGIGDTCAPSYAGRSERDRTYLNPWLEQGYAIAASDYQGLGMPGTHPYMDARTMAFNNLDLIRAVQSGEFPLSKQVVIAGQSQGATGAIATASLASSYAEDVELSGIIATGVPHFSTQVALDLMANSDPDEVSASLALSLYMLALAEMIDPDFQLEDTLTEAAKPVIGKIGDSCVFDLMDATQNAGLSQSNTFESRPDFAFLKVFARSQIADLDFDTPVFTGSGTTDKITPYSMQQAFIADACGAGTNITAKTYSGADHFQALLQSRPDAQAFAQTVLSGGTAENTCPA